jgi:hypothetical protein
MDVAPPPSPESKPAGAYPLPTMLADVYAAPGDVFEYIKNAPVRAMTWLTPMILVAVMAIVYVLIAFSQPGVLQSMRDAREKAFQKQVAAGKMTQAQADGFEKMTEKIMTPGITKLFAVGGGLATTALGFFVVALVLWLAARIVHSSTVSYMKVLEVCALAGMIDVLQKGIRAILVVWKGNLIVTLSPTLFVDNPNMANRTHLWLSLIDPIDVWWLAVLSLGLSKVASIHYAKTAMWAFGLWYGFRAAAILLTPVQQ